MVQDSGDSKTEATQLQHHLFVEMDQNQLLTDKIRVWSQTSTLNSLDSIAL